MTKPRKRRTPVNGGNEFITIKVGERVKRISRATATAYFRGEPLQDAAFVFVNAFLRSAEHHPDARVRDQVQQIRAAIIYSSGDDA